MFHMLNQGDRNVNTSGVQVSCERRIINSITSVQPYYILVGYSAEVNSRLIQNLLVVNTSTLIIKPLESEWL
jgi:hypothetical protein